MYNLHTIVHCLYVATKANNQDECIIWLIMIHEACMSLSLKLYIWHYDPITLKVQ